MTQDHFLDSYHFELPGHLVAERPCEQRDACRLLIYDEAQDQVIHSTFNKIGEYLPKAAVLCMNQSKVIPCRLEAKTPHGGKVEIFILSLVAENGYYRALVRSNGKKRVGDRYILNNGEEFSVVHKGESGGLGLKPLNQDLSIAALLDQAGQIPIPPYIRDGVSDERDLSDYQTVFATTPGSVAAPTAGLHFTNELLNTLKEKGVDCLKASLHVGLGTFLPVKTDDIREHNMHAEEYFIDEENLSSLKQWVEKEGRPLFAVGTTSLRVLESRYKNHEFDLKADAVYSTDIFLRPGVDVQSINGLITNFHLPKSSLLMLVSALIGREKTMSLYEEAIKNEYRFFSYGDAMLILRDPKKVKRNMNDVL